jgi:serine phosphatase RsbU (regulator of sigma subunit)
MSEGGCLAIAERNRPFLGEAVSGDVTLCVPTEGGLFLAIADVLGHGREAYSVAVEIKQFLREHCSADLARLARQLHERLRGTRGAAAGLGYLNTASGSVTYVGIGNTRLHQFGAGTSVSLPSQPGTLGLQIRSPREQTIQLAPGDLLVLTTDGVSERLAREREGILLAGDVHSVAAALLCRHGKDHDDASCIVVRYRDG